MSGSDTPQTPSKPRTLSEKVWDRTWCGHRRRTRPAVHDLHLIHEVTSPQAFDGLRMAGRRIRHPELTVATEDHNVPTPTSTSPSPIRSAAPRWRPSEPTATSSA
ncbi:MAG: hypothetical protein CM1200mP26_13800 [Acidimicrobiales bacterium]|nr:MAG: hypothetical protein CM1200mP26_13800 [Acidimicrobiales bacterium]